MANLRVLFRESLGLVVSAVLTTSLFGGPVLGLVHEIVTTPDIVLPEPPPVGRVIERAALEAVLAAVAPTADAAEEAPAEADEASAEPNEGGAGPSEHAPRRRSGSGDRPASELAQGVSEAVALGGTGERRTLRRSVPREGGATKGRKARCDVEWSQIEQVGDRTWLVERRLVEYYGASIARLESLGWSGRYSEEGEQGWRIGGFGCNSPLYHAGLRRGDVIQSVNGRPTKNILQILATWHKLRKHDDFEVVVLRGGETLRLRYRLI